MNKMILAGLLGAAMAVAQEPDNSKKNERIHKAGEMTAQDQGKSEADVETTRKVRQAVMAVENLSMDGKNVKIITNNGKVTLRGPVASDSEKSSIEAAAKQAAGGQNVTSELEVKKAGTQPSSK
jgi:osmotically-inducible protein OsmY